MKKRTEPNHGLVIVIFNTIRPYAYEVNNILALPNGFAYRCRFERRWMRSISDPVALTGHTGLIVLRDFDTAKFVPLRRIRIFRVIQVGETSHISYVLEEIIDFDSHLETRSKQLEEFNERMKAALLGSENKPGYDLEKLVFLYSDLAYGIKDDHHAASDQRDAYQSWGKLVELLSGLQCFTDFDFVRLVQVADAQGRPAPVVAHPTAATARYCLREGTIHRVSVWQRTYTGREGDSSVIVPRRLCMQGEPGEIQAIRSSYKIAGEYDLYDFSLKTETTSQTRASSLYLDVERTDEMVLPSIEIPIMVSTRWTKKLLWIVGSVLFAIGVALLFGADQIGLHTHIEAGLLERIGILSLVVSSYGVGPIARTVLERIGIGYQL